jgi:hypothetical protein
MVIQRLRPEATFYHVPEGPEAALTYGHIIGFKPLFEGRNGNGISDRGSLTV